VRNLIRQIRARIPTFECRPGCTDCCGVVPWSPWEAARLGDRAALAAAGLEALAERAPERCPFAQSGRCAVYEERPVMCRLFGVVEDLRCPHGCGPQTLLTRAQARAILEDYFRCFNPMRKEESHASSLPCAR